MFFESWSELVRVLISAPILYLFVVLLIRVSGKRSTSQMNNFDWIVTVAMGSMVSSTILKEDIKLLEGVAAISTLILLQYCVTKGSLFSARLSKMVRSRPTLLVFNGQFLDTYLVTERIARSEILSAIREAGLHLDQVAAVVLENDAKLSVIPAADQADESVLKTLEGINNKHVVDQVQNQSF